MNLKRSESLSSVIDEISFDPSKKKRAVSILNSLFCSDLTYSFEGKHPPFRAYQGDAGLDLALQEDAVIKPGETLYLKSGVSFDVPEGFAVHVMTRSSTFRKGVIVIPTIIDHAYKDVASIIVTNNSDKEQHLKAGSRLAQAILIPVVYFDNEIETDRKRESNKFGSSDRMFK